MNHEAIDRLIEGVSLKKLAPHFEKISNAYRSRGDMELKKREDALAYLLYRSPSTMGVLNHLLQLVPDFQSICDMGAAMGTSALVLGGKKRITCVEAAPILVDVGKELTEGLNVVWQKGVMQGVDLTPHDLFLFSYSLNEMDIEDAYITLTKSLEHAKYILIIEPGTPEGYERILSYRNHLIELGGSILAPCPHNRTCPLEHTDRWCHFSKRIERTKAQRVLKSGSLGFEDEKYSYLLFSKEKASPQASCRVIGNLQKEKHQVSVDACTTDGFERIVATKRDKEKFHSIKKCRWGDSL